MRVCSWLLLMLMIIIMNRLVNMLNTIGICMVDREDDDAYHDSGVGQARQGLDEA